MTALIFANPALNHHAAPAGSLLSQALMTVAVTVAKWEQRSRTRRDLRDMDPARYGDVGLTTAEVLREIDKPFFRA
ncbi:DUF1127 domain-containing protein [Jannaschia sp. M317]|uniref:DUF1127 domain-containing protein n=1 Tax=Jannaschia sp. M317 TaxID=2867011 RepID=UPI0021A804F7|nr:hypothetical protein [Jannaschia sp. M317]UWQ17039.1 hypothetical protein K3551_14240 [Jannaschia sp. M317]